MDTLLDYTNSNGHDRNEKIYINESIIKREYPLRIIKTQATKIFTKCFFTSSNSVFLLISHVCKNKINIQLYFYEILPCCLKDYCFRFYFCI